MGGDALANHLHRCAEALDDAPSAKRELAPLRETNEAAARFATALFDLELARRGDAESRQHLADRAQALLEFWRDGSGDALALRYRVLEPLWTRVAPLLVQFERRRFELGLSLCWKVRAEPEPLHQAVEALEPRGQRHVEFARCLYHLELARAGRAGSREAFAARAHLLADAWRDEALATALIGPDAGLRVLWTAVQPYLEEFFEALEEPAAAPLEPDFIIEADEPPAAPPAPPDLDEVLDDLDVEAPPDARAQAFWAWTFSALRPGEVKASEVPRMLGTSNRAQRRRLNAWLDGLTPYADVPEAGAFATLARLLLTQETKEKTLFGQPNPRRREALTAALSTLSGDAAAAGRAAVWFEFDGPETHAALQRGLAFLQAYLAFCARNALDPLDAASVRRFA